MKKLKVNCLLIILSIAIISSGQCSFQYISNDTIFQDYIEFIYARKNADEIITFGSRINRGIINESIYNAPVFQTFDYCGNILNKIIYSFIGNFILRHVPVQTHNTYKSEPIGNTVVRIRNDEFLVVDKARDTITKEPVMILFKVNEKGEVKSYKSFVLNNHEANQTNFKNVVALKDGKILVILSNFINEYIFYYFDENLEFSYKKTFGLGRGIRSIKEVENGEFICTSLSYDNFSFQLYRLDTNGNVKWSVTPYIGFGSINEVLIINNKIYATGGVNSFGVLLICDMDGNILKKFEYDTFYCQQRFCSLYLDSDNSFIIGGYVQHCETTDIRGSDLTILEIDTNGIILWHKLYDYRNSLGTLGQGGYFTDYGGFVLEKANDGGIITNGLSQYGRLSPGGVMHDDALLIKTEPQVVTSIIEQPDNKNHQFQLISNLVSYNLNISGPIELVKHWVVYSLYGGLVVRGNEWIGPANISGIEPGIYAFELIDRNNCKYLYKFAKL